jgi:hypothetical protein
MAGKQGARGARRAAEGRAAEVLVDGREGDNEVPPAPRPPVSRRHRKALSRELVRLIDEAGRRGSLSDEIGALRAVLQRLLAELDEEQPDMQRLSENIPRVVNATVRALKAQRAISGETAGDLTEALTRVLIEMGLGE